MTSKIERLHTVEKTDGAREHTPYDDLQRRFAEREAVTENALRLAGKTFEDISDALVVGKLKEGLVASRVDPAYVQAVEAAADSVAELAKAVRNNAIAHLSLYQLGVAAGATVPKADGFDRIEWLEKLTEPQS